MRTRHKQPRCVARRRLQIEHLESRRTLAATDLASIIGRLYIDTSGNGFDPSEELPSAEVRLFKYDESGPIDPVQDTLLRQVSTQEDGSYRFDRLSEGMYYVQQPAQTVGSFTLNEHFSPLFNVTEEISAGQVIATIDSFNQPQAVANTGSDSNPTTNRVAADEAIGGERDLSVSHGGLFGSTRAEVDVNFSVTAFLGGGEATVTWDGPDQDGEVLDADGLGFLDLTGGSDHSGIYVGAAFGFGTGTRGSVVVYSGDNDVSEANTDFIASDKDVFLPFSSFNVRSGAGADFTNVGAIEYRVSLSDPVDLPFVSSTTIGIAAMKASELVHDFSNHSPTLLVTTLEDEADFDTGPLSTLSLREAIGLANGFRDPSMVDAISFLPELFDFGLAIIELTLGELSIEDDLKINGPGAKSLTIDAGGNSRVFNILRGDVTLEGLDITGGIAENGGAIQNLGHGFLNISQSWIHDNAATGNGGAIHLGEDSRTLRIMDSTLSSNTAMSQGGAIYLATAFTQQGIAEVFNSTISGNAAPLGSGIADSSNSSIDVVLRNSTLTNNTGEAAFYASGTAYNSIIAGNHFDGDFNSPDLSGIHAPVLFSSIIGKRLSFDSFEEPQAPDRNGNLIGSEIAIDPRLGPLADNGGPTPTHALLPDSPALNSGNPVFLPDEMVEVDGVGGFVAPISSDQRGVPRIQLGAVDIGAFELTAIADLASPLVVTTLDDELDADLTGDLSDLSLREALALSSLVEATEITFAASLFGSSQTVMTLTLGALNASGTVQVTGPGRDLLAIDAGGNSRVFNVQTPNANLTIDGLQISGGKTTGDHDHGGGIRFASNGTLTLANVRISQNEVAGEFASGGGVYTAFGDIVITDSEISSNFISGAEGDGSGLYAGGQNVRIANTMIIGNQSTKVDGFGDSDGGGIFLGMNSAAVIENSRIEDNIAGTSNSSGGAIATLGLSLSITDTVISGNISRSQNGNGGGGIFSNQTQLTIERSQIVGNKVEVLDEFGANGLGGGIHVNEGSLRIYDSTIGNNATEVENGHGGGIYSQDATVLIVGSTISGNRTTKADSHGGGLHLNRGSLEIANSTFGLNEAQLASDGGAIYLAAGTSDLIVHSSTIARNTASGNGGGLISQGHGSLSITNTLFASNSAGGVGPDINSTFGDSDSILYSLVGVSTGTGLAPSEFPDALTGNLIGTAAAPVDPLLGPLSDYSGATQTFALAHGSPAIDQGDPEFINRNMSEVSNFDQRGQDRVFNDRIDIGAYEFGNAQPPTLTFDVASQPVPERFEQTVIVVHLDRPSPVELTVPLTVTGTAEQPADYVFTDTVIRIAANQTSVSIPVELFDDVFDEDDETIVFTFSQSADVLAGVFSTHVVNILDDEPLPEVSFTMAEQSTDEETESILIGVRLNSLSLRDVTVPLSFSGTASVPGDFTVDLPIVIPAGEWSATRTLTIVSDEIAERTEVLVIGLGELVNAAPSTEPSKPILHAVTIEDDDVVYVTFVGAGRTVSEGAGVVAVTARLVGASSEPVKVPIAFSGDALDPRHYTVTTDAIEFPVNQFDAEVTINVSLQNDSLFEPDRSVVVSMGTPEIALFGSTTEYELEIADDDQPTVQFTTFSREVFEDVGTTFVQLRLSNPSTAPVVADIRYVPGLATLGVDFANFPRTVTFEPGQGLTATIPVAVINNAPNEVTENIGFAIGNVTGGKRGNVSTHSLVIRDDDPLIGIYGPGQKSAISVRESDTSEILVLLSNIRNAPTSTNKPLVIPLSFTGNASTADYRLEAIAPASLTGNMLTIPAGQNGARLRFTAIQDLMVDVVKFSFQRAEAVQISLGATGGAIRRQSQSAYRVNIIDFTPTVSFTAASQRVSEGRGTVRVTARIPSPLTEDVTVRLERGGAARDTSTVFTILGNLIFLDRDFVPPGDTITIRKGFTEGSIEFRIIDDEEKEVFDESITFRMRDAQGAVIGSPSFHKVTILDNDGANPFGNAFLRDDEVLDSIRAGNNSEHSVTAGTLAIGPEPFITSVDLNNLDALGDILGGTASDINCTLEKLCIVEAHEGFLAGSTVFFDANRNGVRDFLDVNQSGMQDDGEPSEPSGTNNSVGAALLEFSAALDQNNDGIINSADGRLVVIGGTDLSTGLTLDFPLFGYIETGVVTPLTTIMAGLIENHDYSFADALTRVAEAMGLPDTDSISSNTVNGVFTGDPNSPAIFAATAAMHNTYTQVASLLSGASAGLPRSVVVRGVIADIAEKISAVDSGLNLNSPIIVRSIVRGAAGRVGVVLTDDLVVAAANVIVDGNRYTFGVEHENSIAFLEQIVRGQVVSQGIASAALSQAAAGMLDIVDLVDQFTASRLTEKIDAATIGLIIPPKIAINDLAIFEGDNGTSELVFTVSISEPPTFEVTVDYETIDNTATLEDNDYIPASGSLTWAVGDGAEKTIRVTIQGDTKFETTELLGVVLSNVTNALLFKDIGLGGLINDDALDITLTGGPTTSVLSREGDFLELMQNEVSVFRQSGFSPAPIEITGSDGDDDTLVIDQFGGNTIPTGGLTFRGGQAGVDSVVFLGGTYSSIVHTLTNATDGVTTLVDSLTDETQTVQWFGLEPFALFVSSVDDIRLELPASGAGAVLEDADPAEPGTMRFRSLSGEFEATEFRNPNGMLSARGGAGNDSFSIDVLDQGFENIPVHLHGGGGINAVRILGNQRSIDLTPTGRFQLSSIDLIDSSDAVGTTLFVDAQAAVTLDTGGDGTRLQGGTTDQVKFMDFTNWRMSPPAIEGGQSRSIVTTNGTFFEVEFGSRWQNLARNSDVNNDGLVTALDALQIINELNQAAFSDAETAELLDPVDLPVWPNVYYDQNGDDRVTALDALRVINELNMLDQSNESLPPESEAIVDLYFKTKDLTHGDSVPLLGSNQMRQDSDDLNEILDSIIGLVPETTKHVGHWFAPVDEVLVGLRPIVNGSDDQLESDIEVLDLKLLRKEG
ncbi:choice-of-anchor Q domain-containing protein [Neorhodopirellula pilleata]|uniref:Calx-beta domain protein n=1 Tax=Neorhodopirellula pilleata TaxID=2714738 RepID=A0A5C6A7F1_9BACT|nr:choice-of-anchor Q domain-containing protein [Neorhodopirellula pilleata]TWT95439.1 Calx-beta domain protein [Neorhodopirellula pilleata]